MAKLFLGATACAATLVSLCAMPAAAQQATLVPSFSVRVHGEIEPKCSVQQGVTQGKFAAPASSANTARADTASLPFDIDCNTGFQVSLGSTNGALRTSMPNVGGMFADTIAYDARVVLPNSLGGPSCRSTEMESSCERTLSESDLPSGVLKGSGRIALTLVPGSKPLLAGDYTDILVMTVSPRLGGLPLL